VTKIVVSRNSKWRYKKKCKGSFFLSTVYTASIWFRLDWTLSQNIYSNRQSTSIAAATATSQVPGWVDQRGVKQLTSTHLPTPVNQSITWSIISVSAARCEAHAIDKCAQSSRDHAMARKFDTPSVVKEVLCRRAAYQHAHKGDLLPNCRRKGLCEEMMSKQGKVTWNRG